MKKEYVISLIITFVVLSSIIGYFIVNNYFQSEQEIFSKQANLTIENVYAENDSISIDIRRGLDNKALSKIRFIFSTGTNLEVITKDFISDAKTENFIITPNDIEISKIKKIFVIPVFETNGEEVRGNIESEYTFASSIGSKDEEKCLSGCIGLQCGLDPVCGELCGVCNEGEQCIEGLCVCSSELKSITCKEQPCGTKINNCGESIDCGQCIQGYKCQNNICVEKTCKEICQDAEYTCGKYENCNCGTCLSLQTCSNLNEGGICQTKSCKEKCESAGKTCGIYEGCECGVCSPGKECTNLDVGGTCQSCSQTCKSLNYECGNRYFCGLVINCGDCLPNQICSGGICINECSNQCSISGDKKCSGNGYQICGDYDSDSCLEWSNVINCPGGQSCSEGICLTLCTSHFQVKCYNEDVYWYDSCGNREEKKEDCDVGKVCYSGKCVVQKTLRALVVITNFLNTNFYESPEGEYGAINTIQELEDSFIETNKHWLWMSQGTQKMEWNILEITLNEPFIAYAFSNSWIKFREEVVKETKKHINEAEYDSNQDGIIDVIYILAASDGNQVDWEGGKYKYLIGGHMINEGAHTVVATNIHTTPEGTNVGNFNHEIGHCLDNPDIYGNYDTLSYLSLMSDSWISPPVGFSIYEKYHMGWVIPLEVKDTKKDILLFPAEENFQAVKIPTDNSKEYFLIEYRKKPKSGFGSSSGIPNYDGLAIYYVNEEQNEEGMGANRDLPPLIYLEPADGNNNFPSAPEENDFWSPDNTASSGIFEAKKWNSNKVIFRIENLRWSGGGIMFDVNFV